MPRFDDCCKEDLDSSGYSGAVSLKDEINVDEDIVDEEIDIANEETEEEVII